jgi:hypothetical protein
VEAGGVNVLVEAERIIRDDARSLRDSHMLHGALEAGPEVVDEIEHLERVADLLKAAALALGVA